MQSNNDSRNLKPKQEASVICLGNCAACTMLKRGEEGEEGKGGKGEKTPIKAPGHQLIKDAVFLVSLASKEFDSIFLNEW